MKSHFEMMSRYNAWANGRLYDEAAGMPEELYRRNVGAYFGSLHGTLNHLLVADRIWMRRLTGRGENPKALNAIQYENLSELRRARIDEDQRIVDYVNGLPGPDLENVWVYQTLNGSGQSQPIRQILAHLFNHQTHHRGQAHAILTQLGVKEPAPMDLLIMQRLEAGA